MPWGHREALERHSHSILDDGVRGGVVMGGHAPTREG